MGPNFSGADIRFTKGIIPIGYSNIHFSLPFFNFELSNTHTFLIITILPLQVGVHFCIMRFLFGCIDQTTLSKIFQATVAAEFKLFIFILFFSLRQVGVH